MPHPSPWVSRPRRKLEPERRETHPIPSNGTGPNGSTARAVASAIERMAQPSPESRRTRLLGIQGPPTRSLVPLSQSLRGDRENLVCVDPPLGSRAAVAAHPPGISLLTEEAVEHELPADLDQGDVAAPRRTAYETHPIARLEQGPHREAARADLDGAAVERGLETSPEFVSGGHARTCWAWPSVRRRGTTAGPPT